MASYCVQRKTKTTPLSPCPKPKDHVIPSLSPLHPPEALFSVHKSQAPSSPLSQNTYRAWSLKDREVDSLPGERARRSAHLGCLSSSYPWPVRPEDALQAVIPLLSEATCSRPGENQHVVAVVIIKLFLKYLKRFPGNWEGGRETGGGRETAPWSPSPTTFSRSRSAYKHSLRGDSQLEKSGSTKKGAKEPDRGAGEEWIRGDPAVFRSADETKGR